MQADCQININIRTETVYEFDFACASVVNVLYSLQRKFAKNMKGPIETIGNHFLAMNFTCT